MHDEYSYLQVESDKKALNSYQKKRVAKTVKAIIKVADKDKNGKINWEEALAIFKKGVMKSNPNIKKHEMEKL